MLSFNSRKKKGLETTKGQTERGGNNPRKLEEASICRYLNSILRMDFPVSL